MARTYYPFVSVSDVASYGLTASEISYLTGITSVVQTQLDAKIPKSVGTAHGDLLYFSTSATPAVLAHGSDGQLLQTTSAGAVKWITMSGQAAIADGGAVTIALLGATAGAITASKAVIVSATGGVTGLGPITFPYSATLYIPILIGTKANDVGAGKGIKLAPTSTDDTGGVQIYCDDGGAALAAGEVVSPLRARYLLTAAAETAGHTQTGLYAQLVTTGAKSYTNGVYSAAHLFNQGGTVTLAGSAQYYGINAATTLAGTMTVVAGTEFAGIDINLGGVGPVTVTTTGIAAGLVIRHKGQGAYWPIGIYLPGGTQAYTPIRVGTKANDAGSGVKLVATGADDSAGVQIYGEDGGSAAAAGEVISPLRSRYLLTSATEAGGYTETGLFAQLVSTGAKAWSAGVFEAAYIFNQAGTITLTGTAQNFGLNVATTLAGAMSVGATAEFAGIDINISGDYAVTVTTTGTCAGLVIRDKGGTAVWPLGIYIDPSCTKGLLIGKPSTSTGSGLAIGQGYDTYGAPVGIYFNDAAKITQWGECFTVGSVITNDSTSGNAGWPYTGFFYTDVRADITATGNNYWPTLMTNFSIGNSKTLNIANASSHHASVDVGSGSTLASGSTMACISFGGNFPGTISGAYVVPLNVRPTNELWSAFVKLAGGVGGTYQAAAAGSASPLYLKVLIDTKLYTIEMFAAS